MKIKHFAGYGSVNAVKVSSCKFKNEYDEDCKRLVIKVSGNHEWGLVRDDTYDIFNWLVKRFDKSTKDKSAYDYHIYELSFDDNYIKDSNGLDVEVCTYTIEYREKRY